MHFLELPCPSLPKYMLFLGILFPTEFPSMPELTLCVGSRLATPRNKSPTLQPDSCEPKLWVVLWLARSRDLYASSRYRGLRFFVCVHLPGNCREGAERTLQIYNPPFAVYLYLFSPASRHANKVSCPNQRNHCDNIPCYKDFGVLLPIGPHRS